MRTVLYRLVIEISQSDASLTERGLDRLGDAVRDAVDDGAIAMGVVDALVSKGLPKGVDEAIQIHVMDLAS